MVARIAAIEALLRPTGDVSVTIRFVRAARVFRVVVCDTPNLAAADASVWESGCQDIQENVVVEGICYLELEVVGARDPHSSLATIVPHPAWSFVWAQWIFKDRNGRVLIGGFYHNPHRQDNGLERSLSGSSGVELLTRHYFAPTCAICGFAAGYGGPGSKTVAVAQVDFRVTPSQIAAVIGGLVRDHRARHGFADMGVCVLSLEELARAPVDAEIATVVPEAARRVYRRECLVYPSMPGTGSMHVSVAPWGIPAVCTGVGCAHSNVHAPKENIRPSGYLDGIMHIAAIYHLFAGGR